MVDSDDLNVLSCNQDINPLERYFEMFFELSEMLLCELIAGCDDFELNHFNAFYAVIFPGSSIWYRKRAESGEQFITKRAGSSLALPARHHCSSMANEYRIFS